ncbi:MAG: PASTA domain-containing protein [Oscillospiraceae bacterium]|nr:PASTA domain-containing protein [Oscillospiraceae bacterium]
MNSILKIFIPVLFCMVCCAVPLGIWLKASGSEPLHNVSYVPDEDAVLLPEVLYLPKEEAVSQLTALGLRVIEKEKIHHTVIPENQILTQSPPAGTVLKSGDTVMLTVSDGWSDYVPSLLDMPKEKASEKLISLGFSVEYQESSSETVAPGAVMAQSVPADTRLSLGSQVVLTISAGRENTDVTVYEQVGNYIGMDFEEAKAQLSELYLYALQADTVYDPDIPNGTIISQDIPAGSAVPQGTSIQMRISLGQVTVHVPDCSGKTVSEARKLLEDAGLVCMVVYTASGDYPLDAVISQDTPADLSVAKGSRVWLTASVGASSYVISTGGWSGNPLPSFNISSESETELLPDEELADLFDTAPEIIDPEEPEILPPEFVPELPTDEPLTEPVPEQPEIVPEYVEAPETAPF